MTSTTTLSLDMERAKVCHDEVIQKSSQLLDILKFLEVSSIRRAGTGASHTGSPQAECWRAPWQPQRAMVILIAVSAGPSLRHGEQSRHLHRPVVRHLDQDSPETPEHVGGDDP
ncbi:hypothetical protein [Bradyrhizobium sp.]|uniref:hypothetical protein n=1 Tax=Bradyrhizobium sp. TaxID=376 RepID=UPI002DDCA5E4|nr:hypothetical protein [Bradyrhizobium sp.]HEV2158184.1 hypothetical protein [Bradyrhizobium sp.]